MKTKIEFLSEWTTRSNNAGSKARYDVETILEKRFPMFAKLGQIKGNSTLKKIGQILAPESLRMIYSFMFEHRAFVILQYPFYTNFIYMKVLKNFIKKRRSILFIHDIDSMRFNQNVDKEISLLNQSVATILHNSSMERYLKNRGLIVPTVRLELFDYLLESTPDNKKCRIHYGKEIVFAGNLKKSQFLPLLKNNSLGLQWNLYGDGLPECLEEENNIIWKGSYDANEIPFKLEGSFGLVWDGSSLDGCTGFVGNYLKYNNPHKLSLYMASGIPVITWSQAAIAEFVQKNHVGIVVDSLKEIANKLDILTEIEYNKMCSNVRTIQNQVIHGAFTERTLTKIQEILD